MRTDFNLNSLLGITEDKADHSYFKFAQFAGSLTKNLKEGKISGNLDQFFDQMSEFFRLKSRLDYLHEPDQMTAANDELKLALIKL
jgi:hypothetical protein